MSGGNLGMSKLPCWDGEVGKVGEYVMAWVPEKNYFSFRFLFDFISLLPSLRTQLLLILFVTPTTYYTTLAFFRSRSCEISLVASLALALVYPHCYPTSRHHSFANVSLPRR